jgi:hypothetical protein
MRSSLVVGIAIVLIGGAMAAFGAIHSATFFVGRDIACGPGCSHLNFQDIVVSFYLYPIWSPPTSIHANYSATSCTIQQAWYTPLNPPPSCFPPPVSDSANYAPNLIGVALVVLGLAVTVGASIQHGPKVDKANRGPQTWQNQASKS